MKTDLSTKQTRFWSIQLLFDLFVIIGATVSLMCCKPQSVCETDHGVPPCDITGPLDSLFSDIFPGCEPGGVVVVMRDGKVIYDHAFGIADMETGAPITDSTLFNMASASKIFTAAALLKLQEQGKLNLDDSLSMYFPEFKGEFFNKITIRHILTHSSGLPDLRPRTEEEWDDYIAHHKSVFVFGKFYQLYGSEGEHMNIFQNLEDVEFTPGTHYQRHDPAYILVAPLIERITGIKFDDWMAENILKPAGMANAMYYKPDFKMPHMAHAYRESVPTDSTTTFKGVNGVWEEFDYGEAKFFLTKADRGLYASARDFMEWNRSFYSGKIISDTSLQAIMTPYIETDVPYVSFGLGTAVRNAPHYPTKTYHMNTNGGFSIVEGTWPSKKLNYVVFSNRADWNQRKVINSVDSILKAHSYLDR